MDISWDDARLFLAIAETGSFSGAARRLRIGQPTVSRRLAALEYAVGATLFRRSVDGAALTAAGERLVLPAKKMAEWAGELHREHRTPVFGLWAQAVWASVLCISGTYGQLLDYVIFAALVFYFLTTIALFRLRRLRPDLPRPVKAFGYPVLPALYLVAVGVLMVILLFEKPLYTWPGLLIVATGIPVYLIWRGRQTA